MRIDLGGLPMYSEPVNFYIVIETTNGKLYQSDTESARDYVGRVLTTSGHVPPQGCWDRIQHWVDDMAAWRSTTQKIAITKGGQQVYFNPDCVLSITLVKVKLP